MPGVANELYQSERWHKTKNAYLASQNYICERCGAPATCVHHREHLTSESMKNPVKALCFDNLEALCQACHNKEHFGGEAYQLREGMKFDKDGNVVIDVNSE